MHIYTCMHAHGAHTCEHVHAYTGMHTKTAHLIRATAQAKDKLTGYGA